MWADATEGQKINPQLAFLPLMYFRRVAKPLCDGLPRVIDGVIVAYLQDREEIDWAWAT